MTEVENEMDRIWESPEVLNQRIKDLCAFVRASIPGMFEVKPVAVPVGAIQMLLAELDTEFASEDPHHGSVLVNFMAIQIAAEVYPVANHVVEHAFDNDEDEEGSVVVAWTDMIPIFEGDLGVLQKLAGWAATSVLNGTLWTDTSWEIVANGMTDSLSTVFDYFYGMFGLVVLFLYIQIVQKKKLPMVAYIPA